MKCPLFTIMDKRTQLGEESDYCECLKEECAWYQKELQNCIIYQLGMEIGALMCFLPELRDKMPPEWQFRT